MEPSKSEDTQTRSRQFLHGRWTCLLEQCLKLLGEKLTASCANDNLFFAAKLQETRLHATQFCQQLAEGSDLGAEASGTDSTADEFVDNRFCELAADFFRLRICLTCFWTFDGESEVSYSDELFVKREYHRMFVRRPDGRGRSLECRSLGAPSLGWLREGEAGACFRLLELNMQSLIGACVIGELDFFEIDNLGMGSGQLEVCRQAAVAGTATEKESAQFWKELAASLLANAVDIDRALLVGERTRQITARQVRHLEPSDLEDSDEGSPQRGAANVQY